MVVVTDYLTLTSRGFNDMKDITGDIARKIEEHGLSNGTVTVFIPGSTAGVTTIEYEGGLVADFEELMQRLAPQDKGYHHDARWGDGNGFSHVRASLLGPSLTIPVSDGKMVLGTWQQIVFIDFDNKTRSREIILQFMGEEG